MTTTTDDSVPTTADDGTTTSAAVGRSISPRERERFQAAFGGKDAPAKIRAYLQWRRDYGLDEHDSSSTVIPSEDDAELWTWAVRRAWTRRRRRSTDGIKTDGDGSSLSQSRDRNASVRDDDSLPSSTDDDDDESSAPPPPRLPQIAFCHEHDDDEDGARLLRDRRGHVVLHVLAARLDLRPHDDDAEEEEDVVVSLYVAALALYLEHRVFRRRRNDDDDGRVTVLLDVRPGRGWANPSPLRVASLTRRAATVLPTLFPPQALVHCVVYPLPRPAVWTWHVVRGLLAGSAVRRTLCPYAGAAHLDSPVPRRELLRHHVDEACLEICEAARLDWFDR